MAATNFVFLDQNIGKDAITATGTVQIWPLGMTAAAKYNITNSTQNDLGLAEFVYVRGSTNAASNLVYIGSFSAQALGTNTNYSSAGPVGIAPAAMSGTGVYGWVQVRGICDYALVQAAATVGGLANVGSVLGNLSYVSTNATTGANQIRPPIVFLSSASASSSGAVVQLNYPQVVGI